MNTYWSKNLLQKFPLLGTMIKLIIPLTEKTYVQSGCQLIQFRKKLLLGTAPVIYTRIDSADVCLQLGRASADILSKNPSMYITGAVL